MVRRAEIAQPGVRLTTDPFHDGLSNTRLADPGLASDQHDLSITPLGLLPATQQQLGLFVLPTSSVVAVRSASNRLSAALARSTCHAGTFWARPLSATVPRS